MMSITLYGPEGSLLRESYPRPQESNLYPTEFLEYWTLKMTALQTVKTSRTIFPSTPHNNPDDMNLYNRLPFKIHLNISQLCQGLQTDLFFSFNQHIIRILLCMSVDIIIEETDKIYGLKCCALNTKSLIIRKGNIAVDKAIGYIRHKAITLPLGRNK
jgi:hypothetical protein